MTSWMFHISKCGQQSTILRSVVDSVTDQITSYNVIILRTKIASPLKFCYTIFIIFKVWNENQGSTLSESISLFSY